MNQVETRVVIVMATYMGSAYVRDQIESVQRQTHHNWVLLVRDDQSQDNTLEIVEEMAARDSRIRILRDDRGNLRQCQNFNALLMAASRESYVMCCDQDDIWFATKIEKTLATMKEGEETYGSESPILVFTDFKVVGLGMKTISEHNIVIERIRNLPEFNLLSLLGYDYVYGCTTMLNQRLMEESLPISEDAQNHDYWLALIAAALGRIVFLDERTMLYRRHETALTGGPGMDSWRLRFERHVAGRTKYYENIVHQERQMTSFFHFLVGKGMKNELLQAYMDAIGSTGMRKVVKLRRLGIRKQGLAQEFAYYVDILLMRKVS